MAVKPTKSGSRARASSSTPLTIVVPLFNEAKGLPALHERIAEVARYQQTRRGLNVEVVYVDDGSRDDTGDVARSLPAIAARRPGRHAIAQFRQGGGVARRSRPRPARRRAVHRRRRTTSARADRDVGPRWLDDGYDVVYTAKAHRENESWLRRAGVRSFYVLLNWGSTPQNPGRRRRFPPVVAARGGRVAALPERNRFFKGLSSWIGFRQMRVDYQPAVRAHGNSTWNVWTLIGLSIEGLTRFRWRRCASPPCSACCLR